MSKTTFFCLLAAITILFSTQTIFAEEQAKGTTSHPNYNEGSIQHIFWDFDEDGIFTKFVDNENNATIIVRGKHTENFSLVKNNSGDYLITMQKTQLIIDGSTEKILKVLNDGGLMEFDEIY